MSMVGLFVAGVVYFVLPCCVNIRPPSAIVFVLFCIILEFHYGLLQPYGLPDTDHCRTTFYFVACLPFLVLPCPGRFLL